MYSKTLVFLISFVSLSSFAKKATDDISGPYQGKFLQVVEGTDRKEPVRFELKKEKKGFTDVTVATLTGKTVFTFSLTHLNKKDIQFASSQTSGLAKLVLDPNSPRDTSCYIDSPRKLIDVCFMWKFLTVEISNQDAEPLLYLYADQLHEEKPLPPETPRAYTLKEAIDIAWKQNYDNRIEYAHVRQAKLGARASKERLLPGLSFGTAVANWKPTFLSAIGAAGDLVPFVFPTRWFLRKKMGLLSKAELDAMTLVRLDTITKLEALFYNYDSDRKLRDEFQKAYTLTKDIYNDAKSRKSNGEAAYPPGSTNYLAGAVDELEKLVRILNKDQLPTDLSDISRAMGFSNPKALTDATIGSEDVPYNDKAPYRKIEDVQNRAFSNSVEIRQLRYLAEAAGQDVKSTAWNWLDPTGDPNVNLGLSLKDNVGIAKIAKAIAGENIDNWKKEINKRANDAVTHYNTYIEVYPIQMHELQEYRDKIMQLRQDRAVVGYIDLNDYQNAVSLELGAVVELETYKMQFRTARAIINRLTLEGYYTEATRPPQIESKP